MDWYLKESLFVEERTRKVFRSSKLYLESKRTRKVVTLVLEPPQVTSTLPSTSQWIPRQKARSNPPIGTKLSSNSRGKKQAADLNQQEPLLDAIIDTEEEVPEKEVEPPIPSPPRMSPIHIDLDSDSSPRVISAQSHSPAFQRTSTNSSCENQ